MPTSSFGPIEFVGYCLIAGLGALQFLFYVRTADAIYDATYGDIARSLLEHGAYQFDFRTVTMVPPGMPLVLALAWLLFGKTQAVMYHVMAVSATLGLSVTFDLLRRCQGRLVALVSCLLLGSSGALFSLATNLIFSDLPYFFVSMLILLLAFLIDRSGDSRFKAGRIALCSAAMITAVMIRSAGIALLTASIAWIAFSFLRIPALGGRRLRLFCIPVLAGLAAQSLWTVWASRHEFTEWAVPGYPHSYFAQLKVRLGNEPDLGLATFRDIPPRIGRTLNDDAVELVKLLTRKNWVNPYWCSPLVAGVILLILIGLGASLWSNGGQLHDWYFLLYQLMYAVWPWNFEMRFLLPAVPLACLYLWRGGKVTGNLVVRRSRIAGLSLLVCGACLSLVSLRWAVHTHLGQAILSWAFWSLTALIGAVTLLPTGFRPPSRFAAVVPQLHSRGFLLALRIAGFVVVAALVEKGVAQQLQTARSNLHFDTTQGVFYPSIEAAQWIKANAPPQAVVMARKQDLVFHYSRHQVIWFPPTANAQVLMEGIRKYRVSLIVVPDHDNGYWRPSDQACFQALTRSFPGTFHLVHRGADSSVFAVDISAS